MGLRSRDCQSSNFLSCAWWLTIRGSVMGDRRKCQTYTASGRAGRAPGYASLACTQSQNQIWPIQKLRNKYRYWIKSSISTYTIPLVPLRLMSASHVVQSVRPARDLVTSVVGTKRTNRAGLTMSVSGGKPEVIGQRSKRRE